MFVYIFYTTGTTKDLKPSFAFAHIGWHGSLWRQCKKGVLGVYGRNLSVCSFRFYVGR